MSDSKSKSKKNNTPADDGSFKKAIAVIAGVAVLLVLELCNFDSFGSVGQWVKYALFGMFGVMAYVLPPVLAALIIYVNFTKKVKTSVVTGYAVLFIFLCVFIQLVFSGDIETDNVLNYFTVSAEKFTGGGIFGGLIGLALFKMLEKAGAVVITVIAILFCVFIANREPFTALIIGLFGDEDERDKARVERARLRSEEQALRRKEAFEEKSRQRTEREFRGNEKQKEDIEKNDDGNNTVITIRRTSRKSGHKKTTILIRSKNKAKPLRDGSVDSLSGDAVRGLGSNLNFLNSDPEDEMHEITAAYAADSYIDEIEDAQNPASTSDVDDNNAGGVFKTEEGLAPGIIPESSAEYAALADKAESEKTAAEEKKAAPGAAESQKPVSPKKTNFRTPPLSILRQAPRMKSSRDNLKSTANLLEEVLAQFGVNAKVINAQAGPSIVRYELQPEVGTRVNKITSLVDDLKLNLAVPDIRIEAPIPGRAAVGIEVPSKIRQTVYIRELLESKELKSQISKLAFAAGKDISGNVVTADIARMPHMLIAGTTGSGKSVFINSILMSILYRTKPSEVGLIIIDPKAVEFSVYKGIPNLVKDVVTDPAQAVSTLRWAVNEMTSRYRRMQLSGVRDFESYNDKFDTGTLNPDEENASRMPQILIVIDELADLMMVAAKEAESLICRLAQLARAAGIHLVIATQRPSVDVVTGLIKANIPARVALLVSSGIDSRTIIDMVGAEKLLGHGDMLFYPTGYVKPVRVQGAYVSDDEIREVVRFLKNQAKGESFYLREAEEIEKYQSGEVAADSVTEKENGAASGKDKYDEYFLDAGLLCIEHGKASSSMLQRQFNIGFNRAARIIDQLTELGAVGPQNGAKPREILVDSRTFKEMWDSL